MVYVNVGQLKLDWKDLEILKDLPNVDLEIEHPNIILLLEDIRDALVAQYDDDIQSLIDRELNK